MNTITLRDHVLLPDDSRVIVIEIARGGVMVNLDNLHRPGWDRDCVAVPWSQMDNVEHLYELFDTESVRTFRRICEMLAQALANRHIYEALK